MCNVNHNNESRKRKILEVVSEDIFLLYNIIFYEIHYLGISHIH